MVTNARMYRRTHGQARIRKLPFRGSKNKQAKSQNLSPPTRLGVETMTINKKKYEKSYSKYDVKFPKTKR